MKLVSSMERFRVDRRLISWGLIDLEGSEGVEMEVGMAGRRDGGANIAAVVDGVRGHGRRGR
jgi:hypothetical protein